MDLPLMLMELVEGCCGQERWLTDSVVYQLVYSNALLLAITHKFHSL